MIKELQIDLWNSRIDENYRCILTNGFIKNNGELVMGKGIAKEASDKYPWIPRELGILIRKHGNKVRKIYHSQTGADMKLISFPTKHNWWEKSDLNLIKKSGYELVDLIDYMNIKELIYLPRPGVGNGGLHWPLVKLELDKIFEDFSKQIIYIYK